MVAITVAKELVQENAREDALKTVVREDVIVRAAIVVLVLAIKALKTDNYRICIIRKSKTEGNSSKTLQRKQCHY